ncbi:glutamate receptor-like protein [Sesbania bispinosa]|nr:glutamate receptor-like protein [Sesbania bispinosa]
MSQMHGPLSIIATATESSIAITLSDLEALLKQVISSNNSTAMSATSGNFHCHFDSACCNHLTANINLLPIATPVSSSPPINIENGAGSTKTKQILGTGRRMGRLFELQSLRLPQKCVHLLSLTLFTNGIFDSAMPQLENTTFSFPWFVRIYKV